MGKLFTTSEDVAAKVNVKFKETRLDEMGVGLRLMSTTKAGDVIKVGKVSQTTQFLTKQENDAIQVCIFEEAFDRLDDEAQGILIELALSNVSYDFEKDKLNVISNPYESIFQLRDKYGVEKVVNVLQSSYIAIDQIAEQEAERKAAEKERRKQTA